MKSHLIYLALGAVMATSCDDGRIYPADTTLEQEGLTIEIKGDLSGTDYWKSAQGCALSAAAFDSDGGEYASVSLNLSSDNSRNSVVLSGVSPGASSVEICVLDRLRKRVVSFASFDLAEASVVADTLRFDAGKIDVSPLSALQAVLFTPTCSACHGGSAHAAAGLSLASIRATAEGTIGVAARRAIDDAPWRVAPGVPDSSLLYLALTSDISSAWNYDHSVETVDPSIHSILRIWITTARQDDDFSK